MKSPAVMKSKQSLDEIFTALLATARSHSRENNTQLFSYTLVTLRYR